MVLPGVAFVIGALLGYVRGATAEHENTVMLNRELGGACGSHLGVTRAFYASGFAMLAGTVVLFTQALIARRRSQTSDGN